MKARLYLSPPHMNGAEQRFIQEAFETNWIAPLGENVDVLEKRLKEYIGRTHAIALSSGTAALHLALKYLGIRGGDTVFCSDLTFAGSCFPILYEGAQPVFIDSDKRTWNISSSALASALEDADRNNALPKAVIVVDLYGIPCDYDHVLPICEHYNVPVIEDAAEALGSSYHGKPCGSFGRLSILSFNANKIITTSGGGMLLTDSAEAAQKIKFWATQSKEPVPYYEHREVGYNYRLSNISAGIGRGQLATLSEYVQKRRWINRRYRQLLYGLPVGFAPEFEGTATNCWLTVMTLDTKSNTSPQAIIDALERENIEARRFWNPMHMQPLFQNCRFYADKEYGSTGADLFDTAVCLPSGSAMCEEDIQRVVQIIRNCINNNCNERVSACNE